MSPSVRSDSTSTRRTTGTADTLIEVGRFLLEARAASRRAAGAGRTAAPVGYVQKSTTTSATGAPST